MQIVFKNNGCKDVSAFLDLCFKAAHISRPTAFFGENAMKDNWAVRQAQTVGEKDFIFLEKPDVRKYLDGLLLRRFSPVIKQSLQTSGYLSYPQRNWPDPSRYPAPRPWSHTRKPIS